MSIVRSSAMLLAFGTLSLACRPPGACPRAAASTDCDTACPAGARLAGAACACVDGVVLEGACVPLATASAFCGKAAVYENGGCVPKTCPTRGPVDDGTGACESNASLRDLGHDLSMDDQHTLGCDENGVLLAESGHARCIAAKSSCPAGSSWTPEGCRADPSCPPGRLPDRGGCVPFVHRGTTGSDPLIGPLVDVGQWTRLAIGPDGGDGTPALCGLIARRPWLFPNLTGASPVKVRAEVTLTFPDNDITRVHERVMLWDAVDHPSSEAASSALGHSTRALLEALRLVGGYSTAASVTTTVRCPILDSSEPIPKPISTPARQAPASGT